MHGYEEVTAMCLEKEILTRLSYSKCDCDVDYRPEIGIVNGICPNHPDSKLLVDGVRIEHYQKMVREKADRLAKGYSTIV